MAPLQEALDGTEWILHAATQDLPCLSEVGLDPTRLFDTELAGRLLGYPRVGLATLVETLLGYRMRKEHSAVDWSTRPLPEPWLEYAALDVEVLVELREVLGAELVESGKDGWAAEEFEWLMTFTQTLRVDPWRRTSGLHKVRGRRALAAVRELWTTRDEIAPSATSPRAGSSPTPRSSRPRSRCPRPARPLKATKGFHGRGADRYADRWVAVLTQVRDLPETQLPTRTPRADGPPPPRAWADKDPVAAARLQLAREAITAPSEELKVPAENLLTPDFVRRVLWTPPATRDLEPLTRAISVALRDMGARAWQVRLTAPLLADAVLAADEAATEPLRRVRRLRLRSRRRRLRAEDRLRRRVDLAAEQRQVDGRHGVEHLQEERLDGVLELVPGVEQRRDHHPRHGLVEDRAVEGLLVGLEEVVGERDLLVGRLEVALAHDLADRLGARGVDHEVGRRRRALGVLRDAQAGDLADGRRALDRRDRHHVEAEARHRRAAPAPAPGCR